MMKSYFLNLLEIALNLKEYNLVVIEKVLKKYNFDLNVRAEAISVDIFVDIANNLVLYEKEK